MAVQLVISVVTKIGVFLVAPVGRQFGYLIFYKRNINNLKKQVQKLEDKRSDIQTDVDVAKSRSDIVKLAVEEWLTRVDEHKKDTDKFFEDEVVANRGCLNGWCPNLRSRYSFSRKAAKKSTVVEELCGEGNFARVSCPAATPAMGTTFKFTGGFKGFVSRRSIMNQVMETLTHDSIYMIGICGMGGVGKTTMVKEVAKKTEEKKMFDKIVMVVVSQNPNLINIQGEIAKVLGFKLFGGNNLFARAGDLRSKILRIERILVILDDVWQRLELNEIGIPCGDDNKGCKIVMTSRSEDVCIGMDTQKNFKVGILHEEEAWNLFKEMAGISNEGTNHPTDLQLTQMAVAKECGGLPIAIVTVGRALRCKSKHSWDSALEQLQKSIVKNITEVNEKVIRSLELSYNYLESEEAKKCFLFCSLYPEDFDIPIEDLVRYGYGIELFERIDSVGQARRRVHSIVCDLKKCCLLLDGDDEWCVKMHDVIRDVAISIASRKEHSFMVRCDKLLKDWPKKDRLKNCAVISLKLNGMHGLPGNLEFPNLRLLLLDCNPGLTHISYAFIERMKEVKVQESQDNFYQGMKEVEVLALSHMWGSLPTSLRCLTNLRTLSLFQCRLMDGDIFIIGALENLEILSFASSYIKELPKEIIGHFAHLKVLDLLGCIMESIFPRGFLSSLSKLEELYVGSIFEGWCEVEESEESAKAIIDELASLSNLVALDITLEDINFWPRGLVIEKVKKFNIAVGEYVGFIYSPCYPLSNHLDLLVDNVGDVIETRLNPLLKSTEILTLSVRRGLKILCDLVNRDVFGCLTKLKLELCDDLEYLIDTADRVPQSAFPVLEILELENLDNFKGINSHECRLPNKVFSALKEFRQLKDLTLEKLPELTNLWKGPTQLVWLGNLRSIFVIDCHKLESMFSLSIARDLVQLQELKIINCRMMEVIVSSEGGGEHEIAIATDKIEFPKLKTLSLSKLANFTAICKAMNAIELPQLSDLMLENIPTLKSLCRASDSDAIIQLFFNKVKLPSIEKLYVSRMENLMEVWPSDLQAKKMDLQVVMCHALSNILFPSNSIKGLQNLEQLVVEECRSVCVAFNLEGLPVREGISDIALPSLERVYLRYLPKLTHVWKENSLGIQGFQNLRTLLVKGCGSLRNLFSYSLAKLLVKLQEIMITECGAMEAIITNEPKTDDGVITNKIIFPQLNNLELSDLPNLTSFCCQTYKFDESLLKTVKVINCPKIKALPTAFQRKLEQERSDVGLNEAVQKADFSTSNQHHILDGKFILSNERNLTLTSADEPVNIWQSQLEVECLHEVRFMLVQCCGKLSSVVSSNLMQRLKNLEGLKVWWCDSLEIIFDLQQEICVAEEETSITQINKLELKYLPKLTHIWKNIPQQTQCFGNLASLNVMWCDNLTYIFTFSMSKALVSLQNLSIEHCKKVEKIVTWETEEEEEEEEEEEWGETFMPVLRNFKVKDLPSLVCFGPEVYDTIPPKVNRVQEDLCPKFRYTR